MMVLTYVYLVKNLFNHKVYIGRSYLPIYRLQTHISRLNMNNHYNKNWQDDYKKYGKDAFIIGIVKGYKSITKASIHEKRLIKKYKKLGMAYNISNGEFRIKTRQEVFYKRFIENGKKPD